MGCLSLRKWLFFPQKPMPTNVPPMSTQLGRATRKSKPLGREFNTKSNAVAHLYSVAIRARGSWCLYYTRRPVEMSAPAPHPISALAPLDCRAFYL
jgi:hypothetical protein